MGREVTPPFDWATVQGFYDSPTFDEAMTREIFLAVGPPDDAAEKLEAATFQLNEIAKAFAFARWGEVQPSSAIEVVKSRKLATLCSDILNLVGAGGNEPTPDNLLPMFGPGGLYAAAALRGESSGREAVTNALLAVYLLKADAEKLASNAVKRQSMKPPKAGRPEERSIKRLLAALSLLYFSVWGKEPTVIRAKAERQRSDRETLAGGEPVGPFVRLMENVVSIIQKRMGGSRAFYFSAESLAKAWERLSDDERSKFGWTK